MPHTTGLEPEPAASDTDGPHLTHQQQLALLKAPRIVLTIEQRIEAARAIGQVSMADQVELLRVWSEQGHQLAQEQINQAESHPTDST